MAEPDLAKMRRMLAKVEQTYRSLRLADEAVTDGETWRAVTNLRGVLRKLRA